MTKKTKWAVLFLIILLIAIIVLFPIIKRKFGTDKSSVVSFSTEKKALNINAEIVSYQTMADKTITTGDILPAEEVDLMFETSGKVVAIYFNEGEYVKKGTLLAKINDQSLQAQLKKLETQIPLAQDKVYRQQTLLKKDAVSQETYESVLTEYNKLQADIDLVKANIALTELRAPFDGVIGLRELSEGAYASPSTKVVKLTMTSTVKIDFSIPENYATEVKKGTKIKFGMEDSRGNHKEYDASVYAVESKIDKETRTLRVRALYPNPNREIVPGRFTSVEITRKEITDAISVPSEAIIPEMGKSIVYLYRSGKAQPAEITTGLRTESRVQALDGISVGDTLIISGVMQLRTGTNVIIDNLN